MSDVWMKVRRTSWPTSAGASRSTVHAPATRTAVLQIDATARDDDGAARRMERRLYPPPRRPRKCQDHTGITGMGSVNLATDPCSTARDATRQDRLHSRTGVEHRRAHRRAD